MITTSSLRSWLIFYRISMSVMTAAPQYLAIGTCTIKNSYVVVRPVKGIFSTYTYYFISIGITKVDYSITRTIVNCTASRTAVVRILTVGTSIIVYHLTTYFAAVGSNTSLRNKVERDTATCSRSYRCSPLGLYSGKVVIKLYGKAVSCTREIGRRISSSVCSYRR